jgi:hypothetical protein
MSERKKGNLEERLKGNPILRKRIESILDLAENTDGKFKTADEAEERAIEELRRLGNELLQEWAINQEKKATEHLKEQTESATGHGKKNSTGRRHSGK